MAPPEPERPFQLTTLLRLGKRYIFRSPWLAILYIVFTLLSSTVIPIAVAANYGKLTNFFTASSATRASQNAAPSSSKTNSADASQHPATAPREPTPGAMTTTYLIWLGLTLALLGLSFAVRYITAFFDQRVTTALRRDLFNQVLQQSPRFFHQHPTGRLLIMVTQFSITVALALRQLLVDPILQLIGIVAVGHALYLRLLDMQAGHGSNIWVVAVSLSSLLPSLNDRRLHLFQGWVSLGP